MMFIKENKLTVDSCMNSSFKEKVNVNERGSYRELKLNGHVLKVSERATKKYIRELIKIDKMQFGFMPKFGTNDANFIIQKNARKVTCQTHESIQLL